MEYDTRHGGPWDRGCCDSYYGRGKTPHYYKGETAMSDRVEASDMTAEELEAYYAGYQWNELNGDKKDWR